MSEGNAELESLLTHGANGSFHQFCYFADGRLRLRMLPQFSVVRPGPGNALSSLLRFFCHVLLQVGRPFNICYAVRTMRKLNSNLRQQAGGPGRRSLSSRSKFRLIFDRLSHGIVAHVTTAVGLNMPTHLAPLGGVMNGADCISLAELTQYALIIASPALHEAEGWPRTTRSVVPSVPGSPFGLGGPASPLGPGGPGSPLGPGGPA